MRWASGVMIVVEKIEDSSAFAVLRQEWNELLKSSASDCLFLTWEWLHTWWKHLAENRRLHVVTVRRDNRLIAIAPLVLSTRRWKRLLPFPALEFMGTGGIGSDYLDVLVRRSEERHALPALSGSLADSQHMLELSRVRRIAAQAGKLVGEIGQRGWVSNRVATDVCPYIDLSGYDWPSYLATLGSAHRYNLRRRLRALERGRELRLERVRSEAERISALRTLITLHNRRWGERGRAGAFCSPALLAFHDELSRLALELGWLRLYVLRLDGQPAAALYGFVYNDTFYFYQSGFDPAFRRHSVGLVAMGLAIKCAIEEGVKTYDFLRGDEAYKFLWTRARRELVRWELYPPGERGALYRQIAELRGSIKKMSLLLNLRSVS